MFGSSKPPPQLQATWNLIEELSRKTESLKQRVHNLETRLEGLESGIEEIRRKLSLLEAIQATQRPTSY